MKNNRWFVLFGALMIQFNLGAIFIYSVYKPFLKITFPSWSNTDLALPSQIVLIFFAVSMIFSGRIQDNIGPKKVATLGGALLGIGLILASLAKNLTTFAFGYGILGGLGIGAAYVCPLATCLKWFPDKRGFITGLVVGGFGLGAMLFTPVARHLITQYGIMDAFLYLGIIFFTFVVLGAQLLKIPSEDYYKNGIYSPKRNDKPDINFSWREMIKTYQFNLLWFTYFTGLTAGLMIIMNVTNIWESLFLSGLTKNHLNASEFSDVVNKGIHAVLIISIFNALGRIICGKISDHIGREHTLIIIFFLCSAVLFILNYLNAYHLFITGVSLITFCLGGFLAIYPPLTSEYFGLKNIGTNYGLMYSAYGVAGLLGPFLAPKLMLITKSISYEFINEGGNAIVKIYEAGSYFYAFLISGILCLLSGIILFFITPPKK